MTRSLSRFPFKDKVIVIIGGTSGLGLEMAREFLHEKAKVIIASSNDQKISAARKELSAYDSVSSYRVDVTKEKSVRVLLKSILKSNEAIHTVICTSGVHLKKDTLSMTYEEWKKVMDVNLNGTFLVNQIFGAYFASIKSGNMINIGSLGSRVALSNACAYSVSKAGVEMLTKSMACELAPFFVRVNAILPGVFKTPLNAKALSDKSRVANILKGTPIHRFGKLHEITSAAKYLAHPESTFVTGSCIPVDGGFLAFSGF